MSCYMVTTTINCHWVRRISAHSNTDGVLTIILHGDPNAVDEQFNKSELVVFLDNEVLTQRLVKAINAAAEPVDETHVIDAVLDHGAGFNRASHYSE
jgi:DNA-binding protein YbaB